MNHEIKNKKGFELTKGLNTISIALVKIEAKELSEYLAQMCEGQIKQIKEIRNFDFSNFKYSDLVVQYPDHHYSIFCKATLIDDIVRELTKRLKTNSIVFHHEDCSGWSGYYLYKNENLLESYSYGLDYTDDFYGDDEKLIKEYEASKNSKFNTWASDGYYEYLLYSKIRTVTKEEIKDYPTFIDNFFRSQDAWLPDLSYILPE